MKSRSNEMNIMATLNKFWRIMQTVFDILANGTYAQRVALDSKHPNRIASKAKLLALRPELSQIE